MREKKKHRLENAFFVEIKTKDLKGWKLFAEIKNRMSFMSLVGIGNLWAMDSPSSMRRVGEFFAPSIFLEKNLAIVAIKKALKEQFGKIENIELLDEKLGEIKHK